MLKKFFIVLISILLMICICSNINAADLKQSVNTSYVTYSKNGVEFKYPSTFKQTSDTFGTSGFEAIQDANGNRFQIQDEVISNSMTLKEIVKREKELTMPDGTNYRTLVKGEEYITLANGLKGYRFESTTNDNAYQIIFLTQKENKVYQFTFSIQDKTNYDNCIEDANNIFDSLMIKDVSYNTYSKNGVEFKYPSTFKQTSDTFDTSGFEAIQDANGNRFQIQDEVISNSMTLKEIVKREKELTMPDGTNYRTLVKGEEYITLANGLKGYRFESTTNDNAYQIIFLTQKENKVYQFTFSIQDKTNYDNCIDVANNIFDSLIIKDVEINNISSPTQSSDNVSETKENDTTTTKGTLPKTGVSMTVTIGIIAIVLVSLIMYKKYNRYKEI